MPTFNNSESGSSVRTKINAAITTVDGLDSGDNLLMDAAERTKLTGIASGAEVNPDVVSQAEAEAGTATNERTWTAQRVAQAIAALETGGGGAVDSVNTQTGAVVLDADDISDSSTTNKYVTSADVTKLGHISVTQAVDLDTMESNIATNNAKVGVTTEEANPAVVSQAEAEAGTATTERTWTAQRVAQAIAALETGGSGGVSGSSGSGAPSSTPSSVGDIYIDTTADTAYIATGTASSADWDEVISSASGSTLSSLTVALDDKIPAFDTSDSDAPGTVTPKNILDLHPEVFEFALSDETTALTTGTSKVTWRAPFAITVTDVRASVSTAPTGSVLTVDINDGGTSILSTKLTIDATEKTSETAATAAVISDSALADDAEITFDIDTVGSTVAGAGLKVKIIGTRT